MIECYMYTYMWYDRIIVRLKIVRILHLPEIDSIKPLVKHLPRPRRDEFIEFAQFLTVMNFLTNTEEGQSVSGLKPVRTWSTLLKDSIR